MTSSPTLVENPLLWKTKTEAVKTIRDHGCSYLIAATISCSHVYEMRSKKPHCGECSQCIERRFATLSDDLQAHDPQESYRHDLLDREAEDFTPIVQRIRADQPDMVVLIMLPPAAYILMNQLAEQGVVPSQDTWLFEGGALFSYPDFWDNVRDAAVNSIFFDLYHPEMPLSAFGERVRDEYFERYGCTPSRLVFQAADSLLLLAEAMRQSGTTDADEVIATLQGIELEGARGVITFASEPGILYQQWVDTPYVTFQVTDLDQELEETVFVSAPGVPVRIDALVR
jgi:branched-chain amino acid transport system substrate-binding protein